jgi:hypothetical protein
MLVAYVWFECDRPTPDFVLMLTTMRGQTVIISTGLVLAPLIAQAPNLPQF